MSDPMLPAGTNYCKCSGCGEYFSNENNFDRHRKGGECIPPDSLRGKRGQRLLEKNDRGYWVRPGKAPQAQIAA